MEEFTDRMRERMPAHRVWTSSVTAPTLSRPAHDALWEDLRTRLRTYDDQRRPFRAHGGVRTALDALQSTLTQRSTAAIVVACVLLIVALFGLLR